MRDLAKYALDAAHKLGAGYADVRVVETRSQDIETKDLSVSSMDIGYSHGLGVRVLVKGGWGFAATPVLTQKSVFEAARRAVEVAKASALCMTKPVTLAGEKPYVAKWISPHLIDPFTVSAEDKASLLINCARSMLAVKGVTLARGGIQCVCDHKYFASSEGARIEQTLIRTGCYIEANASEGDDRQRRTYPQAYGQFESAGWEMVERWDLPGNAVRIAEEVVGLLKAPLCPSGQMDLVLGSSQLALQIHESCGHPSELDRALGHEVNFAGASFLTPDLLGNLQYGSPIVNLVADATASGALGSFGFDDEGVQAQCVDLVKNGIFTGYLSSRDTAGLIGLERSGGAMRADSWSRVPIIRMTNISLKAGDGGSLTDLIAGIDDGVYMETNRSWSIDQLRYNFQFGTEIAYEIKNGNLGRMLKNPSYNGITTDFWNSCDAICSPSEFTNWGVATCGKGQPMQIMWTGHGAAPARFRKANIGLTRIT